MRRLREFSQLAGQAPILANAGWLYADQVVRAFVVLVGFGAMARRLGPAAYGELSYALAYPGIFLPLAVLGLDYVIVRDLVRHPGERNAILGTAAALRLAAVLVSLAAALAGMTLVPADQPARPLLLITVFSLLGQPFLLFDYWFQSRVASKYSAWARVTASVVSNGLRLGFAAGDAPLAWFAWTAVVEAAVYAVGLVSTYRATGGRWPRPWRDFKTAVAARLWQAAWPLLLADMAMVGFLRFDQLLLSQLAGSEALGRYAAAFRLADAAGFFAIALINSYFPRLIALHAKGPEEFDAGLRRLFVGMTWFAIAVAVALTFASPLATRLVLGLRFTEAAPVLVVLAWANVFVAQIAVRGKWFLADGLQVYSLMIFALGAVLHLGGVWLLAPRWGAMGAAASFLAAQAVMAVLAPALWPRIRGASSLALRSFVPMRS